MVNCQEILVHSILRLNVHALTCDLKLSMSGSGFARACRHITPISISAMFRQLDEGESVDGETALSFANESIVKGSEIRTDGLNIYNVLSKNRYILSQKNYDPKKSA